MLAASEAALGIGAEAETSADAEASDKELGALASDDAAAGDAL